MIYRIVLFAPENIKNTYKYLYRYLMLTLKRLENMKQFLNLIKILSITYGVFLTCTPPVFAHPAPPHAADLRVVNTTNHSVSFQIGNNWGTLYDQPNLSYMLDASGTKDANNNPTDASGFPINSNNDEEYYTVTYEGSICRIDYALIRDLWIIKVTLSDSEPHCRVG